MNYQCLECGYKAHQLVEGRCEACGSAKVTKLKKSLVEKPKEAQPVRLFLMMMLWGLLIYKAYDIFVVA